MGWQKGVLSAFLVAVASKSILILRNRVGMVSDYRTCSKNLVARFATRLIHVATGEPNFNETIFGRPESVHIFVYHIDGAIAVGHAPVSLIECTCIASGFILNHIIPATTGSDA